MCKSSAKSYKMRFFNFGIRFCDLRSRTTPIVNLLTQTVVISVWLIMLEIRSSFIYWFSTAIGTMHMESLQHASSVMNHCIRFSEKIPTNFISGVPSTSDFTRGQRFRWTMLLEKASTISSVSWKVCHMYSPYYTSPYGILYLLRLPPALL